MHRGGNSELTPHLCDPELVNVNFVDVGRYIVPVDENLLNYYVRNCVDNNSMFNFRYVTDLDIYDAVSNVRSRATGCDNISLDMLLFSLPFMISVLRDIFNDCLCGGQFPESWKRAVVKPLPKVPNPSSLSDLRPISILSVCSKIFEKVVFKMMSEYIASRGLLPSIQSGFRANYSTCTALLKVTTELSAAMDQSKVACLVLLDYSKAFDLINHELLLAKLSFLGFSEQSVKWFKSYLHGRTQIVDINGLRSGPSGVPFGVPQGSILGPVLFTLFTFDIESVISHCSTHLYADDTQLVKLIDPMSSTSDIVALNEDLQRLATWSANHGLILNTRKCCLLFVGTPHMRMKMRENTFVTVHINGTEIVEKEYSKNLGIMFDNNLNFEKHVSNRISSVYMKLKSLYAFKSLLDESIKYRLIEATIFPLIDYCLPMYFSFLTLEFRNKLQLAQNSCVRFAYSIRKFDHISPTFNTHCILKVPFRYKLHLGVLVKGILDKKEPSYLYEMFVPRNIIHNLNLRGMHFDIKPHRTAGFEACFSYVAVKLINNSEFRIMAQNLSKPRFRSKYKNMLLAQQIAEV